MSTLREILVRAGFTGAGLDTAQAVATAESGGRASAHNPNAATGDNSYGLFQINMLGAMGPARLAQYHLANNEALYDPAVNAAVAYQMSGGGTNWSPWSTFKNGAYKAFLGRDPNLVDAGGGAAVPAGLFGIPGPGDLAGEAGRLAGEAGRVQFNVVTRVVVTGIALATGAALIVLGLNKATGNPVGKAAKGAADDVAGGADTAIKLAPMALL